MLGQTKIEWTDFTVNFWEGCQKVGPGCDHCYAEARDLRFTGGQHWGPNAPRRKVKGGLAKLRKINGDAPRFFDEHGHWPRVFCSSLSDVFDNAVEKAWRVEAFAAMAAATDCRIQLLTKRVGNVFQMIPPSWCHQVWPDHIGLMITVVNQQEADRDIPKLLDLKARFGIPWVGLSMEPLLGPIDLTGALHDSDCNGSNEPQFAGCHCRDAGGPYEVTVDWVICGGESGPGARPMHPDWARNLRDQCEAAEVPFLFKQVGEWTAWEFCRPPLMRNAFTTEQQDKHFLLPTCMDDDPKWDDGLNHIPENSHVAFQRVGKARAGRLLDGRTWDGVIT